MPRRWDDWRCYRCNRWRPQDEPRFEHVTPSGITVGLCADCHAEDATPPKSA